MAKARSAPPKIGFWHMVRDVLVASLNKGQFLPACAFVLFLVIILRMPGEDVSRLAFRLVDDLENYSLLGYASAVVVLALWMIHARFQRRVAAGELKRVAKERTRLQEGAIGQQLQSSDPK